MCGIARGMIGIIVYGKSENWKKYLVQLAGMGMGMGMSSRTVAVVRSGVG